ncbi:MAG: M1 family metallopeptidase [Cyclobacteriaceae bacterium]
MNHLILILAVILLSTNGLLAQSGYWQQRVEYNMVIDFDVSNHQFEGSQKLVYSNNSPDTLNKVFYHLYFNAFQPGSTFDVRSRTIDDPDARVRDRIYYLDSTEIGFHKILSLKQDGKSVNHHIEGTILEVILTNPILPGAKTIFNMEFQSQVPVQIRRSGRHNSEGIDYSMAQWYPKMAEYDKQGWHADPYVGREFYGVWGDFDIELSIDERYIVAATGTLQNPQEIGHGYASDEKVKRKKKSKLTWKFKAENVHDFVWAADPDYIHEIFDVPGGPTVHLFFQDEEGANHWKDLPEKVTGTFQFLNQTFGEYPYSTYSIIQGGDGAMEYPMATLVKVNTSFNRLLSATVHEIIHSWFQGVLGTNESLYAWMDEGFTAYAQALTLHYLNGQDNSVNPLSRRINSYLGIVNADIEEPLTTHADHFSKNAAHSANYQKGALTLHQLNYLVGKETFFKAMRRYYKEWSFKHPDKEDFIRVMEKESGLELDWFFEYFINTTKTIDYGIKSVVGTTTNTEILLERKGEMPMPLEVFVEYTDGTKDVIYIPLAMMRGEKQKEYDKCEWVPYSDWPWTHSYYTISVSRPAEEINYIEIDATQRMMDIDRSNNVYPFRSDVGIEGIKKQP